jgi:P27 family predicted phage terminase small subunit
MSNPKGRPRKATAELKLNGTFQKCRRNTDEPTPDVKVPDMPDILKGEAVKEWNRLAPLLASKKCLTDWDRNMLAAYCYEWGKYYDICKMQAEGAENAPNATQRTKALKNFENIAIQFGLTPSSRTRLSMGKSDVNNPFEKLMKKKA